MRRIRFSAVLLIGMGVFLMAQTVSIFAQSVSEEAREAYETGDYETAVLLYEAVLQDGIESGPLYFNLGSTYHELQQAGPAVLYLRRAQRYLPRHSDVSAALSVVRSQRVDFQGDEVAPLDRTATLVASVVTYRELSVIVYVLALVLATGGAAIVVRPNWRRGLIPSGIVLAVVTGLLASVLLVCVLVDRTRPPAVLLAETTSFYSGPGDGYLELFQMSAGAEVRVVERNEDWARARLPNGRQGWVSLVSLGFVARPS